jgi:hypothetical protein
VTATTKQWLSSIKKVLTHLLLNSLPETELLELEEQRGEILKEFHLLVEEKH